MLPAVRKHGAYMTPHTLEQALLSPDFLLRLAQRLKEEQEGRRVAERDRALLARELAVQQPKIDYFNELVERNLLLSLRETAKLLSVGEKAFIRWLLENRYLFRGKSGKLLPYATRPNNECFEVKEYLGRDAGPHGPRDTGQGEGQKDGLVSRAKERGKGEGEYEHACRSQPDQPQQAAAGRPEPVGEGIHAGVERLQLGGLFVQLALQLGEESALRRACVGIPLGVGANGYNGVQKGVKLCCKLRAAFLRRHGSPPPFYLQFDYSIPGRKVNRR